MQEGRCTDCVVQTGVPNRPVQGMPCDIAVQLWYAKQQRNMSHLFQHIHDTGHSSIRSLQLTCKLSKQTTVSYASQIAAMATRGPAHCHMWTHQTTHCAIPAQPSAVNQEDVALVSNSKAFNSFTAMQHQPGRLHADARIGPLAKKSYNSPSCNMNSAESLDMAGLCLENTPLPPVADPALMPKLLLLAPTAAPAVAPSTAAELVLVKLLPPTAAVPAAVDGIKPGVDASCCLCCDIDTLPGECERPCCSAMARSTRCKVRSRSSAWKASHLTASLCEHRRVNRAPSSLCKSRE